MSKKNQSTALEVKSKKKSLSELLHSEEGSGFIEKLIIIGLFVFVVSAGINYVGTAATDTLNAQGDTIGAVNSSLGTAASGGMTP